MKPTSFTILFLGCAAYGFGCSTSPSGNDAGLDASNGNDSGSGKDSGAGNDSGSGNDAASDAGVVNGCTSFTDMTADGGTITGPSSLTPSQYSPNCVHIKVGQSVTWNANFTNHPMAASGGTTPSPITTTTTGTTVMFAFPNAGTYGFHCQVHPTIMFGAVEVTQ